MTKEIYEQLFQAAKQICDEQPRYVLKDDFSEYRCAYCDSVLGATEERDEVEECVNQECLGVLLLAAVEAAEKDLKSA